MSYDEQPTLSPAARYFPLERGRYEVAAGLKALGTDFGNEAADRRLFQIDAVFNAYRTNKLQCRAERLSKYYVTSDYKPAVQAAVTRFLVNQYAAEYPHLFRFERTAEGEILLRCQLTSEVLHFDSAWQLTAMSGRGDALQPAYASAFDALCSQVPEDVAVVSVSVEGDYDWLTALHLCSPSHWAAEDKIGRTFTEIHAPVPGIERITGAARSLVDVMINKGPYVRFVWGITADTRLNHHPEPPPGREATQWRGRPFDPHRAGSPFTLRVERQVIWGLPEVRAAVFAIRIYFVDAAEIRANPRERALLRSALLSMTPESRNYKGLTDSLTEIVRWLDARPTLC